LILFWLPVSPSRFIPISSIPLPFAFIVDPEVFVFHSFYMYEPKRVDFLQGKEALQNRSFVRLLPYRKNKILE